MVIGSWRGISYARRWVKPANPQTSGQTLTRNVFRFLEDAWKIAPALLKAPWDAQAKGQKYVGRNHWVGVNMTNLRGETDLNLMAASPGAKGGLPPISITLTAADGQIGVDFANPAGPEGWEIHSAVAACLPDQDPSENLITVWAADDDQVTKNAVTLTGLDNGVLYQVFGWLRWTKPDGSAAYSPSISDTATPTA